MSKTKPRETEVCFRSLLGLRRGQETDRPYCIQLAGFALVQ